ncbi:hypothetical protein PgNI_05337 [Pyricularia grisea]|uniref:Uncharacterized protein n=1 Tax=Pyricularia grisea TaxID=148305 RepID=A0A6P8B5S7_PYRGI|nr:hypothetical protein PgNI_05337 [Pyricularia grisea]TLD10605.1 hypothetical protein PgNI_05337 [Pyricularia grisea]
MVLDPISGIFNDAFAVAGNIIFKSIVACAVAAKFILIVAILIWDPTRKVNLYEILSELRMLIVSACLPLLAGILIALAPVMVYYMIKLSWDKERSLSDNLEMMWRPPASADSKPNSNEDAPPTPSQPENVDQPPIDPSPKEIEKEYV